MFIIKLLLQEDDINYDQWYTTYIYGNLKSSLTNVNMNAHRQEEDADESEIDESMNKYGRSTCMEATELHRLVATGYLKQQPRR